MTRSRRSFHVSSLCLLASSLGGLAAGCAVAAESSPAEELGEAAQAVQIRQAWTTVATPYIDHQDGAAVLLGNGKVLVTNGRDTNAEIYDPVTNTWASTPYSPWNPSFDARYNLTAWLLPSGNVAVSTGFSGGFNGFYDLYDATTNLWTSGVMSFDSTSFYHAGVTLQDGRAVLTGGSVFESSSTRVRAFDEPTLAWSTIGDMVLGREQHTSTVLADGRVLSVGGNNNVTMSGSYEHTRLASTEIFDPATGASALAGSLATARFAHTATRLANGQVLIAGGRGSLATLTSSELHDPTTGTWSSTGALALGRTGHTATRLQDGRVLVTGGATTKTTELYAPATGTWSAGSPMSLTTRVHTATLLDDGRVLVVGSAGSTPTAEIYDPSPQCVTFQRGSFGTTADTQIGAASPTKNYGTSTVANSGLVGGSIRQTLLSFNLSPIPAGSKIDSAALTVHENTTSGATSAVDVHRITAAWAETTVTWSSFAGAYDPTIEATFLSGVTPGSRTVDITGVVQGWRSGATTNNGVLLAQPSATTFTSYNTGEATPASTRPALEVCFVAP